MIVAIFTVYSIIIDDLAKEPEFRKDLNSLNAQLLTGKPQNNFTLHPFVKFLATIYETYGQFASDTIIKDTFQFMGGSSHEAEGEEKSFRLPAEVSELVYYLRTKVGLCEAYAWLLLPTQQFIEEEILRDCLPTIPYLMLYFN